VSCAATAYRGFVFFLRRVSTSMANLSSSPFVISDFSDAV